MPAELRGVFGYGDVYTWVASMRKQNSFPVGMLADVMRYPAKRSLKTLLHVWRIAFNFSTDGFKVYLTAVEEAFGSDIDYGMIVKVYGHVCSTLKMTH